MPIIQDQPIGSIETANLLTIIYKISKTHIWVKSGSKHQADYDYVEKRPLNKRLIQVSKVNGEKYFLCNTLKWDVKDIQETRKEVKFERHNTAFFWSK